MSDDRPVKPLTERRQRFAEKQAQQGRGLFADQHPQGTGPSNRHGMPQLPPGQRRVPNWPVLDLGDVPNVSYDEWRLEVDGLVERPLVLTWREFMALPQTDDQSRFPPCHHVEPHGYALFGCALRRRGSRGGPDPSAQFVVTTGYDVDPTSGEPYTTNLSLDEAMKPDVLLVHSFEAQPLSREHGGPCRMVTPQLYAWERSEMDSSHHVDRNRSARLLGATRLLEHRNSLVR